MTEAEWREQNAAILFVSMVADAKYGETDLDDTDYFWRHIATKVACLQRLGNAAPVAVRDWIAQATDWLDEEQRRNAAYGLLNNAWVYAAFREAFAASDAETQQILAAAQDIYHGSDYYGFEYYLLEDDESHLTYTGPVYAAESKAHCDIIRDIFGNPFRPVAFDPAWRTEHAVGIAGKMYDERAFAAMPILADALEEAGCDSADILSHCREPGVHVRGCWVVDLVLGK